MHSRLDLLAWVGYRGETGPMLVSHEYYMIGVTAMGGSRGVLSRPGQELSIITAISSAHQGPYPLVNLPS